MTDSGVAGGAGYKCQGTAIALMAQEAPGVRRSVLTVSHSVTFRVVAFCTNFY